MAALKRKGYGEMIGVFTAELHDSYQASVWRGIERRAHERGVGVVCFLGSRLDSPVTVEATANMAYRLAGTESLDGLIVITSAINTFLDSAGVKRLFDSYRDLPRVSVGVQVAGIPSVTVDGSGGISTVVRHLIEEHGCRQFAVIGGPPGHAEAEDRAKAFRRALEEAGLPFDERLLVSGIFVQDSGAEAARRLIDLGIPFDALVCMNDRMAIGAIDALHAAGIDVPTEVAVVGFDGIEESNSVTPPLTTVIQPLHELGANALDMLCDIVKGRAVADRVLSCVPVIRESCGCVPQLETRRSDGPPAELDERDRAVIEMLTSDAQGRRSNSFIARLNSVLASDAVAGRKLSRWNGYLAMIRGAASDRTDASSLVSLFEFAQILVGRTEIRLQAARRVKSEEQSSALRALNASLAGSFEIPTMLERLSSGLHALGIGGGYLVVFPGGDTARARLLMSPDGVLDSRIAADRRDNRQETSSAGEPEFDVSGLLPAVASTRPWRSGVWVFEPLVFQDEALGYVLLPGGFHDPTVYDAVRDQVASALKGALLLEQVRTHERRLEVEVARRTAALTRANRELTLEIERRTRLEQEVIEISNRTMERIGQDLHDDLSQHLAGVAMLASVVRADLSASGNGAAESIGQICTLLEESIARAKQIARGLVPTALQEHGLVAAVEELAASARRSYPATIDFRASPGFFIDDTERALQVYRIIQEALSNALKHSDSERVEIRLYREETDGALRRQTAAIDRRQTAAIDRRQTAATRRRSAVTTMVAEVTDFGSGFSGQTSPDGMGLRIMRYRAEKAELDLHIEQLSPGTRVCCRVGPRKEGLR